MNAKINTERLIENVVHVINDSNKELTQENANTNGSSPAGQMSLMAGEVAKEYGYNLINDDAKAAFENGFIHIHDFDYYATGTTTCCQIPLGDILAHDAIKGIAFKSGDCGIRTPKGIETAASLAAIILQTNQNQQHGGQSFPNWDFDLAPYVTQTYNSLVEHYNKVLKPELITDEEVRIKTEARVKRLAKTDTKEATQQAMEAFVHNCNSMLCRNGMQVPFVSINFGLDTTWQGRMISECTFLAQEKGIGNGETPIFPILVFKVKTGVNFTENDPNYDLYKLGVRVLSTRLFPNFMFMDSSFNSKGFDLTNPKTHPATMGAVEGKEVITYTYEGNEYTESFERMWARTSIGKEIKRQCETDYFTTTEGSITILDKDINGKNHFVNVKTVIKNDDQGNWWKLKLNNGRSLKLTEDHPLVTKKGRVRLENLEIGDEVFIDYDGTDIKSENSPVNDKMWLLGMIICDGCYSGGRITITVGLDELELIEKAGHIFQQEFNLETKIVKQERGLKGNYYELVSVGKSVDVVKELCNIFDGINKTERRIPTQLLTTKEKMMSMLGGMIDADGHIKYVKGSPRLEIGSTNKELALQQLLLLQACGYKSKMYLNKYSKNNDNYRYKVETYVDSAFIDYIMCNKKRTKIIDAEKFTVMKTPKTAKVVEKIYLGYINEFGYDVETESDKFLVSGIHSHNCRTRVYEDSFGESRSQGRGNLSFTTLNLPMLAKKSINEALDMDENIEVFLEYVLPKYMKLVAIQLKERYEYQMSRNVDNFKFLYKDGPAWEHESNFTNGKVGDAIKSGSLGIGFIGLAETLILLTGTHHGESSEARRLGLKIVKLMRQYTNNFTEEYNLNYALLATPKQTWASVSKYTD